VGHEFLREWAKYHKEGTRNANEREFSRMGHANEREWVAAGMVNRKKIMLQIVIFASIRIHSRSFASKYSRFL
jgi:hypothetical protein